MNYKIATNNAAFYNAAVGVLLCSVFVLPAVLVMHRLMWPLEDEEEEEGGGGRGGAGAGEEQVQESG